MPCSDVTEVLELRLDTEDRVAWYRLRKRTCGGSLGMPSLIQSWLFGKSIDEVLGSAADDFLGAQTIRTVTGELIHLKHYFAVRAALLALTGQVSPRYGETFLDSIVYDSTGVELVATIPQEFITDEIRACQGCGSCGAQMKPAQTAAN